ncbi:MAG: recombinase A [Candidatus Hydrogenedentes bacterium]|nr:recombinase A [Candidatus Hydrogenedentota bacterium]
MDTKSLAFNTMQTARELSQLPLRAKAWGLDTVLGRFVELGGASKSSAVTVCAGLVVEAQERGGLATWIGGPGFGFFPPDFDASGIDLSALPVVRVTDESKGWHVADTLLRSGAFALVVLDVGNRMKLPLGIQTRLVGLAKKHQTALVMITRRERRDTAGGSLVSLRGETDRRRMGHDCFTCTVQIVKDKRRTPGWNHGEMYRGPDGLC